MNSTRKIAVITGVLFIIATSQVPSWLRRSLPVLTGTDYLTRVSAHPNQVAAGVLLSIIALLRMCRHSHRDVSGLEEVECRSGPSDLSSSGPLRRPFTWSASCA